MNKVTKKHMKILNMLNDFGYLDEDFFAILFHSKATQTRQKIIYKVRACLNKLIKSKLVSLYQADGNRNHYSLSASGRRFLFDSGVKTYSNNSIVDSGKFSHSKSCAKVYAKIAANYKISYQSENDLRVGNDSPIVPDLAVRFGETIVYFEIERSLKSEVLIKEKLSNYSSKFKDGYLIYLTESDSIINKISKIKHAYPNYKKILAFDYSKFFNDPKFYLKDIGSFSDGRIVNENQVNMP